jgi:hypothetical protein
MSRTVSELRNAIRSSVGRFEREVSSSFTKEELVAVANTVGYLVDGDAPPSTSQMRAGIRWKTGLAASEDAADTGSFRKAELATIAEAVGSKSRS